MLSERELDRLESHLADDLASELADLSAEIDVERLEAAIAAGDLSAIERESGVDHNGWALLALLAFFGPIVRDTFEHQARLEAEALGVDFDALDIDASNAVRQVQQDIVRLMGERARETILGTVLRAGRAGLAAGVIARLVQARVWTLDRNAARADAVMSNMLASGMSMQRALRAALQSALKHVRARIVMIARSETARILARAKRLIWRTAIRLGRLDPNQAEVEWITAADEMVCPTCRPYHGERIPITESFAEGDPPLHPRCRCQLLIWPTGKSPR